MIDKVSLKKLRETESTVLYHIYQSALDNDEESTEYMRHLKSIVNAPEYILNPFDTSILLLLSNLHREQSLQILKLAILRQIQEKEISEESPWLKKILPVSSDIMTTISKVIENR